MSKPITISTHLLFISLVIYALISYSEQATALGESGYFGVAVRGKDGYLRYGFIDKSGKFLIEPKKKWDVGENATSTCCDGAHARREGFSFTLTSQTRSTSAYTTCFYSRLDLLIFHSSGSPQHRHSTLTPRKHWRCGLERYSPAISASFS